jgi:hypothetical protein
MQSNIKSLLQSIFDQDMAEPPKCQSCQNELHAYIEAELDGEDVATLFPEIAHHLDECQECQQAYDELQALLVKDRQGELAMPPVEPDFDFSYLEEFPEPDERNRQDEVTQSVDKAIPDQSYQTDISERDIWQRINRAGQQVSRLFSEISVIIGPKLASFGSLPSPLTPQFVPVLAARGKTPEAEAQPQVLNVPIPEQGFSVSLKIGLIAKGQCTLTVQIDAAIAQAARRARVTLRDKAGQMLESKRIDEKNEAVNFDRINPGSYLIEVKYQDQLWELPLTFAPQEV